MALPTRTNPGYGGLAEKDFGIFGIEAHAPTQNRVRVRVVDLELVVYKHSDVCAPNLDAIIVPPPRYGSRFRFRCQEDLTFTLRRDELPEFEAVGLVYQIVAAGLTHVAEQEPACLPFVRRRVLAQLLLQVHLCFDGVIAPLGAPGQR